MSITTIIPKAQLVTVRGRWARILCPYCGGLHEHTSTTVPFTPGTTHHRAPGCGQTLSGDARATGYRFTI